VLDTQQLYNNNNSYIQGPQKLSTVNEAAIYTFPILDFVWLFWTIWSQGYFSWMCEVSFTQVF